MHSDSKSRRKQNPPKNHPNKTAEHTNAAQRAMQAIPAPVEPNGQKPPYYCAITCEKEKSWWDKVKPIVELAGVILLAIYTLYTIKMYCANKEAADAAKSAADTAKEALHVSERAYLGIVAPIYKSGKSLIAFEIVNTGHLRADNVQVIAYRLAINAATPGATHHTLSDVVDVGKDEFTIQGIQPGLNSEVDAVFENLDPTRTGIQGTQLVVVGSATYNDGFSDEPRQTLPFCINSVWQLKVGRLSLAPCDPNDYIQTVKDIMAHMKSDKR